jgi:hypothetical protein
VFQTSFEGEGLGLTKDWSFFALHQSSGDDCFLFC